MGFGEMGFGKMGHNRFTCSSAVSLHELN